MRKFGESPKPQISEKKPILGPNTEFAEIAPWLSKMIPTSSQVADQN